MNADDLISEKDFQATVIALAQAFKWKSYHTHDSRRSTAGFPDLVLARDRLIVAELKTQKGKVTSEQEGWLAAFRRLPFVEVYVWRPSDRDLIEEVLR